MLSTQYHVRYVSLPDASLLQSCSYSYTPNLVKPHSSEDNSYIEFDSIECSSTMSFGDPGCMLGSGVSKEHFDAIVECN